MDRHLSELFSHPKLEGKKFYISCESSDSLFEHMRHHNDSNVIFSCHNNFVYLYCENKEDIPLFTEIMIEKGHTYDGKYQYEIKNRIHSFEILCYGDVIDLEKSPCWFTYVIPDNVFFIPFLGIKITKTDIKNRSLTLSDDQLLKLFNSDVNRKHYFVNKTINNGWTVYVKFNSDILLPLIVDTKEWTVSVKEHNGNAYTYTKDGWKMIRSTVEDVSINKVNNISKVNSINKVSCTIKISIDNTNKANISAVLIDPTIENYNRVLELINVLIK